MSETGSGKKADSENHNNKASRIFHGIISNMLKHFFFIFRTYLDMFIDFVFGLLFEGERKKLPELEPKHKILLESAVSLAEKIRKKELKSEELMKACIERIQAVNPLLNAVTDERYAAALKDAREVDRMIEEGLPDEYFQKKPFLAYDSLILEEGYKLCNITLLATGAEQVTKNSGETALREAGVPFTAKESHAVSGMFHTLGISSRKHLRAHDDAECVRLLKEAGAIPVAVTNVPEINKWMETRNMVFGQTRNPHHMGRTTGGSSGGEAALQAAVAVPISLCSDIGGSTRMPAFYCGLYALNPTAGYTSLKGSALRTGLDPTIASIGFVSRHCTDLIPLTKIVAGDKAKELNLNRAVDIKKLRYFYVEKAQDVRLSPICKELRDAMTKVITKLTEEAPSTDLAPKPFYHKGFNHMYSLWRYWMSKETEVFAHMLTNKNGETKFFVELPKKLLGMSEFTLAAILKLADDQVLPAVNEEWAEQLTKELREELIKLLGDDGVLLFPSAPAPAPYHYSLLLRPFNFAYWGIFNALKFPAAQIPLGLSSDGLPLGIQVVAAPKNEALCIAVAQTLGTLE